MTAIYILSPMDLLPDLVPVLGWVDDIGAVLLTGALAAKQWFTKASSSSTPRVSIAYEPLSRDDLRAL